MNQFKKIITLSLTSLSLAVSCVSCTDGFEDINKDPNKIYGEVEIENIFPGSVYKTMNLISRLNYYRLWFYGRQLSSYAFNNVWNDRGDSYFRGFYVDIIRDLNSLDKKYAESGERPNAQAIAKTWKALCYYQLTSLYGPIAVSDAEMGDDQTKRVYRYDDEEKVYDQIIEMLDQAVDLYDIYEDPVKFDPVYNGDISKWRKLSNTLRLEVAMNIQNISMEKAKEAAARSLAHEDWIMQSNDDSLAPRYGTTVNVDNSFYWYELIHNQMLQEKRYNMQPSMNEYFATYLYTYNDPRMQTYFEKSNFYKEDTGKYVMPDILNRVHDCQEYGCNADQQAEHMQWLLDGYEVRDSIRVFYHIDYPPSPENGGGRTPFGWQRPLDPTDPNGNLVISDPLSMRDSDFNPCRIKQKYISVDSPLYLLRYSDACFLMAEAKVLFGLGSRTATDYYEAGILASFTENGIAGDYEAYVSQDGVKWGTDKVGFPDTRRLMTASINGSNGQEGQLQQIYVQRWIASFTDGLSQWRLDRRTRALNLPPLLLNSNNSFEEGGDANYAYPERLYYPDAERINNGIAYYEAISMLQRDSKEPNEARWGDNVWTLLKFAKPVTNKEATIAGYRSRAYVDFNMEMQEKKYGRNYEEFVKKARELTGIQKADSALKVAFDFEIRSNIKVYKEDNNKVE